MLRAATAVLLLSLVSVLALAPVAPVQAVPTVMSESYLDDEMEPTARYFYYTLINPVMGGLVTGFHIWAPIDAALISVRQITGWTGVKVTEGDTTHFYWTPAKGYSGLGPGERVRLGIIASVDSQVITTNIAPFEGATSNWGYGIPETASMMAGSPGIDVPIMVPEPASMAVLTLGCLGALLRRRR